MEHQKQGLKTVATIFSDQKQSLAKLNLSLNEIVWFCFRFIGKLQIYARKQIYRSSMILKSGRICKYLAG